MNNVIKETCKIYDAFLTAISLAEMASSEVLQGVINEINNEILKFSEDLEPENIKIVKDYLEFLKHKLN